MVTTVNSAVCKKLTVNGDVTNRRMRMHCDQRDGLVFKPKVRQLDKTIRIIFKKPLSDHTAVFTD